MTKLNALIKPLHDKLNAFSVRERVIITTTLLVALFFVWNMMFLEEQIAAVRKIKNDVSTESSGIASMQMVQKMLTDQLSADPNRAEQIRLERYLGERERLDQELREQTIEFISPQQMIEVLKGLIRQQSGLKLVSLESIETEDPLADMEAGTAEEIEKQKLSLAKDKAYKPEPSGAYLHTLELKFKGDYLSAMRYIQQLEALEWRFIWKSMSIQLEKYPVTNVEIQLQTMGLTEGWVGV